MSKTKNANLAAMITKQKVKTRPKKRKPILRISRAPHPTISLLDATGVFLREVDRTCRRYGVKLRLEPTAFVESGEIKCSGYFVDKPRSLVVATGKDISLWLPTLVHEYCHMLQWIANAPVWTAMAGERDCGEDLERWLQGKRVSEKILDTAIDQLIAVELDCERRSARKILQYGLPIDQESYIQKANAYVLFYHAVRRHRQWYNPLSPPYQLEAVWKTMPTNFDEIDYFDPAVLKRFPSLVLCLENPPRQG